MKFHYAIAAALVASAACVGVGQVSAQPGSAPEDNRACPSIPVDDQACHEVPRVPGNRIVGWWHHTGTLARCDNPSVVLRALNAELLFQAGGTLVSVDTSAPTGRQTAVGIWTQTGPDRYLWRMQFNRFNPDGSFDGAQDIQADMRLDAAGVRSSHSATVRVLNPDGSLRAQVCESGPSDRVGFE